MLIRPSAIWSVALSSSVLRKKINISINNICFSFKEMYDYIAKSWKKKRKRKSSFQEHMAWFYHQDCYCLLRSLLRSEVSVNHRIVIIIVTVCSTKRLDVSCGAPTLPPLRPNLNSSLLLLLFEESSASLSWIIVCTIRLNSKYDVLT